MKYSEILMRKAREILYLFLFPLIFSLSVTEGLTSELQHRQDPGSARRVLMPTALPAHEGSVLWHTYMGALGGFEYAASQNIEFGLQTLNPLLGFLSLAPTFRYRNSITSKFSGGFYGSAGLGWCWLCSALADSFGVKDEKSMIYYFSGGPMFTYGDETFNLTISSMVYGGLFGLRDGYAVYPTLASGMNLIQKVLTFNVEVGVPFSPQTNSAFGETWTVAWTFRFFRNGSQSSLFLDLGFLHPIGSGSGKLYGESNFTRLGVPILWFGFRS